MPQQSQRGESSSGGSAEAAAQVVVAGYDVALMSQPQVGTGSGWAGAECIGGNCMTG